MLRKTMDKDSSPGSGTEEPRHAGSEGNMDEEQIKELQRKIKLAQLKKQLNEVQRDEAPLGAGKKHKTLTRNSVL